MSVVTSPDGFQTTVVRMPAPGVPGDFAGANIRANVIGGPGQYVATPAGVLIGAGAYADPATGQASNYYRQNAFQGFVHREGQSIITAYLGIASQTIPGGDAVTVMNFGEFWGLFSAGVTAGQYVYADPVSGALSGGSSGASVTASNTSVTTSGGNTLTLVGTTTGTVAIGQIVVAAGLPNGTYITGGSGTSWTIANLDGATIPVVTTVAASFYGVQQLGNFRVMQTVAAPAQFTATLAVPAAGAAFGTLTVSAVASGVIVPGQWIYSTGTVAVPTTANIEILEQLTGTAGGTGTYQTTNTFYAVGSGQTFFGTTGLIAKISSIVGAAY